MTTAERREAILAQLGRKPIAARTLAAKYGVSRQVIVQDLAVLRAAHPNVISTARGYVRQQAEERLHPRVQGAPHPRPDRAGAESDR